MDNINMQQPIYIEGSQFKTVELAMKWYGAKPGKVRDTLISKGCSLEDAIITNYNNRSALAYRKSLETGNKAQPVVINNMAFKSKKEALKAFNIKSIDVSNYINKHNCTFEQAVIAINKASGVIVFNNKFNSLQQICDYYNLDYDEFITVANILNHNVLNIDFRDAKRNYIIESIVAYMIYCKS